MTSDAFSSVCECMCAHKYTRCAQMQVLYRAIQGLSLAGRFMFPGLFEAISLQI